jgi:glycine cleavage system H lipoate-binding protein
MSEKLLYAKTHEWARVESDPAGAKTATVGLTAFALEMLTDLVHI